MATCTTATDRPTSRSKLALVLGLVVVASGLSGVAETRPSGAGVAHAAGYSVAYTGGDGVALRSAPTASAKRTPMIVLRDGTGLSILCQQWSSDGSAVGPRANRIFNKIFFAPVGEAWVPDAYVAGTAAANTFTPGIPRCGSTSPNLSTRALAWANARVGQQIYTDYCLTFVYDAYLSAGKDIGRAYSADRWARARQSQLRTVGTPPAGSLVFWWGTPGYPDGHVAISRGDGTAVSTAQLNRTGVHVMNIAERSRVKPYAGWISVG